MKNHIKPYAIIFLSIYFIAQLYSTCSAFYCARLSDAELDNICVGGFDFNLNAAYAYRSAVLSQVNIAAADLVTPQATVVNSLNKGLVYNVGDSAVASQANVSVLFSQYGDIIDAIINNTNMAKVANVFQPAQEPASGAAVTALELTHTAPAIEPEVVQDASLAAAVAPISQPSGPLSTTPDPQPLSTSSAPAVQTAAITNPQQPVSTPAQTSAAAAPNTVSAVVPKVSMKMNEIVSQASAVVAQTNVAAVVASQGNIKNVQVNNTNQADVQNEGNAALAAQTNVTVMMAGGEIENSNIVNSNTANVSNIVTTQTGGASVTPLALDGAFGKILINQVAIDSAAQAAQTNITLIKTQMKSAKNQLQKAFSDIKFFDF